jgi:hypothetical protein
VIRKLNYTGRKKILVKDIRISTFRERAHRHTASLTLQLAGYIKDVPADSVIVFEAYTRTRVERFELGTVAEAGAVLDERCTLETFSDAEMEGIHFRVKIVDQSEKHGRIVAIADRLPRKISEKDDADRRSILGVDHDDLGDRLWKLDLEKDDIPYIIVNTALGNVRELARDNDVFFGLVYPEAVRQILEDVFLNEDGEDYADCNDTSDWRFLWSCFARSLTATEKVPKHEEARKGWIEQCVQAFCSRYNTLNKASKALGVAS